MAMVTFSAQNVIKRYAGVVALAEGNLLARSGEVVALIGANGSGKSTLCKIITGVVAPDGGQLLLNDQPVSFAAPHEAMRKGISAVYQELSLVPSMSVAENIWLSHEPLRFGVALQRSEQRRRTQALIDLFAGAIRPSLKPETLVASLPPDEQQIVEILKALSQEPEIMILDEATSSLDKRQVNRLFELVQTWKQQGKAIIFISHRMGEIFRIADRVTVLRNGRMVGDHPIGEVTEKTLVNLMVKRDTLEFHPAGKAAAQERTDEQRPVILQVQDLATQVLKKLSFEVRQGELLGIGGLQGQGQSDVLKAIFGAIPYSGAIILQGKPLVVKHPEKAMQRGVAFVPGDRNREGLLYRTTIFENLMLPSWGEFGLPLRLSRARQAAQKTSDSLRVVMDGLDAPISSLSGGNAQKIVIGKWLQRNPVLLLLNDPTKGVDVNAKSEFYDLLAQLQAQGASILLYSSDDEELIGLCNRVLVMYDGRLRAELMGEKLTLASLVAASLDTGEEHWA
jgi:ribose transport system ATP-binding protein